MKRILINLIPGIIISAFTLGCSSTQTVSTNEEFSIPKQAKLITRTDESIDVYNVIVLQDSVMAVDLKSNKGLYYPRSEIDRVVEIDRRKGALHGALLGTLAAGGGVLLGSVMIGLITDSREMIGYSGLFALISSPIGLVLGPIPGSIIGSRKFYILDKDSTGMVSSDPLIKNQHDSLKTALQEQFSQKTRADLLKRSIEPNNHIAFSGYGTPGGDDKLEVMAAHYRRYFGPSKAWGRLYFNYTFNYFQARGDESDEVFRWEGNTTFLTMGLEMDQYGMAHTGAAGFWEVGMVKGRGEYRDNYSTNSSGTKIWTQGVMRDGYGVVATAGVRGWWNLLFGEVQVGFDTWTQYMVPRLVVGYRF